MARIKELCNAEACHQIKDMKLEFYRYLPPEMQISQTRISFEQFRQGIQRTNPCMDRNCGPLIELRSRE